VHQPLLHRPAQPAPQRLRLRHRQVVVQLLQDLLPRQFAR
jgi:hypothetical protein